jgi:hypothetical protein
MLLDEAPRSVCFGLLFTQGLLWHCDQGRIESGCLSPAVKYCCALVKRTRLGKRQVMCQEALSSSAGRAVWQTARVCAAVHGSWVSLVYHM